MISIDFRYRFPSINYVWRKDCVVKQLLYAVKLFRVTAGNIHSFQIREVKKRIESCIQSIRFLFDWSRAIVDNSTDHGNEVMVAQIVFLSFPEAIFPEKSTETDDKNCQCYCKKQWTTIFHGLYSYRP